jgi:hypothetical protein
MAKKPKNDDNGPAEPDFSGAVELIRKEIQPDKTDISKINGDLSASWKRVEDGFHVNKKAAKDAMRISQMPDETRNDYWRSFFGMIGAFGCGITQDLVDQMGDTVSGMPVRESAPTDSALLN